MATDVRSPICHSSPKRLSEQHCAYQNSVFDQTAAYWNVSGGNGLVFGADGSVGRLQFSVVTGGFFPILGVRPTMGRTFSQAEEAPGGTKVFIASYAIWQRLCGGHAAAIGRSFYLDGDPYTLSGVLPADFNFPARCDIRNPVGTLGARSGDRHRRVTSAHASDEWIAVRVHPADPLTLAAVSALLAVAGALACWIPARRAMDPMIALRSGVAMPLSPRKTRGRRQAVLVE
jgi:hypothetical protein